MTEIKATYYFQQLSFQEAILHCHQFLKIFKCSWSSHGGMVQNYWINEAAESKCICTGRKIMKIGTIAGDPLMHVQ